MWIDMNEPTVFGTTAAESSAASIDGTTSIAAAVADDDRTNLTTLSCPLVGVDAPPYLTVSVYARDRADERQRLCSKSLCMCGLSAGGAANLYNTRNLYGWSETRATSEALRQTTGKRGAVISR